MSDAPTRHVVVVGGGITGLTAAYRVLSAQPQWQVTLIEADDRLGGKIRSSRFAGIDGVDEGADAFLTRVPHAMQLAAELGLGDTLTSPAVANASVFWPGRRGRGLRSIPQGLLLGVPTDVTKLARSGLLSWRGTARAALEPFIPASADGDSIGRLIRARFGDEVQERLVDPLVGSIYAADTDHFSLGATPQLAALASRGRSLLLAGRRMRAAARATSGPVFATPQAGMAAMTDALVTQLDAAGATLQRSSAVRTIERVGSRWSVIGDGWAADADAVILTTPARATAPLLQAASTEAAASMVRFDHAGVVLITLAVDASRWPDALRASSGYLVPKPVQRSVTAVSFASAKWAHWRPTAPANSALLRVSLGRDGHDLTDEHDDALIHRAISDVEDHLGLTIVPSAQRISRWPAAFPQYRPGHLARVDALTSALRRDAPGVFIAGASYGGIGIPACIQQAGAAAAATVEHLAQLRD